MAELKTKLTGASVDDFLGSISDEQESTKVICNYV